MTQFHLAQKQPSPTLSLIFYSNLQTSKTMAFQFSYAYTVDGRNVGQSTTFATALMYRFDLFGSKTK